MLFLKAALDFKIVARSRGENTDCGDVKTELRKVSAKILHVAGIIIEICDLVD